MTKTQKVWLGIFLAMFIVPEVLWGPVLGILPFGKSFVSNSDNHAILVWILFTQLSGIIGIIIVLLTSHIRSWTKWFFVIISVLLGAWTFYIFYLVWATSRIWS